MTTPPEQRAPPNGAVFDYFPRTTTLQWMPVPGAVSYGVEIDCFHCCQFNAWCTDIGRTWIVASSSTTEYTFNWVGAQPGRWRVWAVDAGGRRGPQTGWWVFEYRR